MGARVCGFVGLYLVLGEVCVRMSHHRHPPFASAPATAATTAAGWAGLGMAGWEREGRAEQRGLASGRRCIAALASPHRLITPQRAARENPQGHGPGPASVSTNPASSAAGSQAPAGGDRVQKPSWGVGMRIHDGNARAVMVLVGKRGSALCLGVGMGRMESVHVCACVCV